MDNNKYSIRLNELALRALENAISDDEFAELNELLNDNPDALAEYFELVTTCSALYRDLGETISDLSDVGMEETSDINLLWNALAEEERTAETIDLPKPAEKVHNEYVQVQKVLSADRSVSKFQIATIIGSIAALLFFVVFVKFAPTNNTTVATLTDVYEAKWSDASEHYVEGENMWSDYLELTGGYVEITFNCGASVIIEGPAKFELESESELYVQTGKLSCYVPPQALGFTVVTPSATVVDFGTKFGVIVEASGRTEAHVFKGEIDLRTGSDPLVFDASRRLTTGQGSIVNENKSLLPRRFKARENEFIREEIIPYEIAIRKSKPFAYWRFDASDRMGMQDVLTVANKPCEFYGNVEVVAGPALGDGKTSGAVQLDGKDSYLYVPKAGGRNIDGKNEKRDFSYSFWVRPDVIRAQDIITVTNKGTQQYRHIGLDDDGRFSFFTYHFKNQKRRSEFSGNTVFDAGQWYHVVVTGTRIKEMKSEMHLYVNGKEDASKIVGSTYSPQFFGHFYLGSVPDVGKVEGVHSFDGAITEVVEYDRALTRKEVRGIYSSVK